MIIISANDPLVGYPMKDNDSLWNDLNNRIGKGQRIVDIVIIMEMAVVKAYIKKEEKHLVTFKS